MGEAEAQQQPRDASDQGSLSLGNRILSLTRPVLQSGWLHSRPETASGADPVARPSRQALSIISQIN